MRRVEARVFGYHPDMAAPAADEATLTRPSTSRLLRLLWGERRLSRAELARRADVARSTVTRMVNALLPTGLVRETGMGPSHGGRRPVLLEFRDDAYAVAGVDLSGERVAVALTDLRGSVHAWEEEPHPVRDDPDGARRLAGTLLARCADRWRDGPAGLVCVGAAIPSPVDTGAPTLLSALALPAWRGRPGLEALEARFGVPVVLDNDANLGALAEQRWGAGQGVDDLAYLAITRGVGAGLMIGGRIHRGQTGVAGELGHFPADPRGPLCECGMRGCLSSMVDVPGIERRASRHAADQPGSALGAPPVSIAALERAAVAGDPAAAAVIDETVDLLANAIATVLNLNNPGRVVIGGGILRLGEALLGPLRRAVQDRTRVSSAGAAPILAGVLGDRAIAVGAATLALDRALGDLRLFPPLRAGAGVRLVVNSAS